MSSSNRNSTNMYEGSEKHKKIVQKMARMADNKECADCTGKGPSWVSWNLGVFICIKCAGIHRKLGTHISQVRSTTLDKWALHQAQNVERIGGNARANAYYEHSKPDRIRKPRESDDVYSKEKYIRNKYEKKLWVRKDGEPLVRDASAVNSADTSNSAKSSTASRASSLQSPKGKITSPSSSNGNPMRSTPRNRTFMSRRTKSSTAADNSAPSLLDFGGDSSNDDSSNHQKSKSATGLEDFIGSNGSTNNGPMTTPVSAPPRGASSFNNGNSRQQQQPVRSNNGQQWDQSQNFLIDENQERSKNKASIMGLFDQPQPQHNQYQQRPMMPPQRQQYPPQQQHQGMGMYGGSGRRMMPPQHQQYAPQQQQGMGMYGGGPRMMPNQQYQQHRPPMQMGGQFGPSGPGRFAGHPPQQQQSYRR